MGVVLEELLEGVIEGGGGRHFAEGFAGGGDEGFPPLAFDFLTGAGGAEHGIRGLGEGFVELFFPSVGWVGEAVGGKGAGVGFRDGFCGLKQGSRGVEGDPVLHELVGDGIEVEAICGGAEGGFAEGEVWGLIEVGGEVFVEEAALGCFHGGADEHADHFVEETVAGEVDAVAIDEGFE